jgi:uncharacterized protein
LPPKPFRSCSSPSGHYAISTAPIAITWRKRIFFPGKTQYRLDEELLELYIRDYIASQQVPVVSFVWQGGEPSILGVEYYRKAVELQKKYAGDRRIENSFPNQRHISLQMNSAHFLKRMNS